MADLRVAKKVGKKGALAAGKKAEMLANERAAYWAEPRGV